MAKDGDKLVAYLTTLVLVSLILVGERLVLQLAMKRFEDGNLVHQFALRLQLVDFARKRFRPLALDRKSVV